MSNYQEKYIKYKNKYLLLKKQLGGCANCTNDACTGCVGNKVPLQPITPPPLFNFAPISQLPPNIIQTLSQPIPPPLPPISIVIPPRKPLSQLQPKIPPEISNLPTAPPQLIDYPQKAEIRKLHNECPDNHKIRIENREFRVLKKIYKYNRDHYLVTSCDIEDKDNFIELYFYRSITELGFLRLLYGDYNKGSYDYIQQTFINLELQGFINSLDTVETADSIVVPITSNRYIIYEIEDLSRQISIPVFYNFTSFKCGHIRKESDTRDYLIELSEMIQTNYKIVDNKPWFNYRRNNDKENIDVYVYETKLQNKTNDNEILILYWIYYNVKKFNGTEIDVQGSAPLFLTSTDSHITPCGLYSKYIPSGYYICKVFEYNDQVDHSNEVRYLDHVYSFIGRLYDELFPYSELPKPDVLP